MQTDVSQQREVRQLSGGSALLEFYSKRIDEEFAAKALEHPAAQAARRAWFGNDEPAPLDDSVFTQHILYDLNVGPQGAFVRDALLTDSSIEESDIVGLAAALADTHLSLLEVVESKRGRGIRLLDRLTLESQFVESTKLADTLEPMEVILGRIGQWDEKHVLLPGWEKVWFRGRKAVIRDLLAAMETDGLTADDESDVRAIWLCRETPRLVRRTREANPQ